MKKALKIICLLGFLFLIISCNNDYKYLYKSKKNIDTGFMIQTFDNRTKMKISTLYQNEIQDDLYYLKVNNEFYQCDKSFSRDSIIGSVQFSTIKEYDIPYTPYTAKRKIEKVKDYYITTRDMSDYTGTLLVKFFYDKDYKIFKIESNYKEYVIW